MSAGELESFGFTDAELARAYRRATGFDPEMLKGEDEAARARRRETFDRVSWSWATGADLP